MISRKHQRGFISSLIAGIGGVPLWIWGYVGLGLLCGGLYIAFKVQSSRLETAKIEHNLFVAGVKSAGETRKRLNEAMQAKRDAITQGEQDHANELYDALDMAYRNAVAAAKRVPNSDPGSSRVPALSEAASSISCTDRQADAVGRLEKLEIGILALLRRGNEAIARTIVCKEWMEKQTAVK